MKLYLWIEGFKQIIVTENQGCDKISIVEDKTKEVPNQAEFQTLDEFFDSDYIK